jgi:hypothetical protein
VLALGPINLYDMPGYGTYQHGFAEMLAAHDELISRVCRRRRRGGRRHRRRTGPQAGGFGVMPRGSRLRV